MSAQPVIDWQELLTRIRARSGRHLSSFHEVACMDERTINRLARGEINEPRFSQGVLLLDLASDHFTEQDWKAVRRASPLCRRDAA